jgi:hypothetical protein
MKTLAKRVQMNFPSGHIFVMINENSAFVVPMCPLEDLETPFFDFGPRTPQHSRFFE